MLFVSSVSLAFVICLYSLQTTNKPLEQTTTEIGAERGKKDAKIKSFFNNSFDFDEVTKF